jgi:hypothetical protein
VPLPALDLVEPPVAEQLRSAEREVEQAAARRANARELTVVGKAVAEAPSSTVARTNLSGVLLQLSEYDAAIERTSGCRNPWRRRPRWRASWRRLPIAASATPSERWTWPCISRRSTPNSQFPTPKASARKIVWALEVGSWAL